MSSDLALFIKDLLNKKAVALESESNNNNNKNEKQVNSQSTTMLEGLDNASNFSVSLDKKGEKFSSSNYGVVTAIKDGIVTAIGLEMVCFGELVCFNQNPDWIGMVLTLRKKEVEIVLFMDEQFIHLGDAIYRMDDGSGKLGKFPSIKVGYELLGKHIDSLGNLMNEQDLSEESIFEFSVINRNYKNIFKKASGIIFRESVKYPFYTGYQIIDNFFPIGCGQRELLIGDKFTGKTTIAVTSILNQKESNIELLRDINLTSDANNYLKKNTVFCIYVAIGQRRSNILRVYNLFQNEAAIYYTCIVSSTSSCNAVLQYLTPYVGTTIGEFFMENGHNAFIVYDDLSNHAVAYRQMSLLLKRPPGREAFPGDIFFIHSSLLERSAQMHKGLGGGSLTSFPIIETQCGDVSSYIPTNVISITDGQIYLDKKLFNRGMRPAVHTGLSVSRVGSAAQNISIRSSSKKLKIQYDEYQRYVGSFSGTDLVSDPVFTKIIQRGFRLREILKQRSPRSYLEQVVIGYSMVKGFTSDIDSEFINVYYQSFMKSKYFALLLYKLCSGFLLPPLYTFIRVIDFFRYQYPSKHITNLLVQLYSLEDINLALPVDELFEYFSVIFSKHVQPRLSKLSLKLF